MSVHSAISLDDKYTTLTGTVYLSGIQSLVRLLMLQSQRDRAKGWDTRGFVSGYRGSPLGGLDKELWHAQDHLTAHAIHFQPGLNEDLAATSVWGTQQVGLFGPARACGIFSLWYGKGPGVDRSVDVLKHANAAGTAPKGGVLMLLGDDHGCKSSTLPHQSEQIAMAAQIPVLNPANVQELMDFGLIGWAMSRYAGLWVGMKAITETVESSGTVSISPWRVDLVAPRDFPMPGDGPHIRWPDRFLDQEARLMQVKIPAALAFARANRLDRTVLGAPRARFGIVTTGKAYLDVMQALSDLGIDRAEAARLGLAVFKVAMTWPLDSDGIRHFAEGLEEILIVEEKRPVLEDQIKQQLYNWRDDVRPRVVGKSDEQGQPLLPQTGELTPALVARVIAGRIGRFYTSLTIKDRLDWLDAKDRALAAVPQGFSRIPYFCAGCPHNGSTALPFGSLAMGGVGCHFMATWMPDRPTLTYTHMGGEGANWIGIQPFSHMPHIFQNLGDGTYYHSGLLAIRAALAAGVTITYKILFNDAVAMTGGQKVDGPLSVAAIARQVHAEGVSTIRVVAEDPRRHRLDQFPPDTRLFHRDRLDDVQRELAGTKGISVLIFDQTCAAEKRRRRKRGLMADPDERIFINELVCEGCGDCGEQSNCVAVSPVETEFGRKRTIDQSACNKDFSCAKGFCPSFVMVKGAKLKRHAGVAEPDDDLPSPVVPSCRDPFAIIVTGIGGTGVVTVAQVLGMAAHMEGKGVTALDQTGLAQKNGAVVSHLRLCDDPSRLNAVRIAHGGADLLLACDLVVAAGFDTLSRLRNGRSRAVINTHQSMPAAFTHHPDLAFPAASMQQAIHDAVGGQCHFLDATRWATGLMGDALAVNMFMVGWAWQAGLIPLSKDSILAAIALNGAQVSFNHQAFRWGRRAFLSPAAVQDMACPPHETPTDRILSDNLEQLIHRRVLWLTGYQNRAWADRYLSLLDQIALAEKHLDPASQTLTRAAAHSLFRLMSFKDEYEVARLYGDASFTQALKAQFESWDSLEPVLAPPFMGTKKRRFGPWMLLVMRWLAKGKILRFTPLDPFGWTRERRQERQALDHFIRILEEVARTVRTDTLRQAVELLTLPQGIRGFGAIKTQSMQRYVSAMGKALESYRNHTKVGGKDLTRAASRA